MNKVFYDGSVMKEMSIKELIDYPVWKGNRTLDMKHLEEIKNNISDIRLLDSTIFALVICNELDSSNNLVKQTYLIDGQHRAAILREHFRTNLCVPDFSVCVKVKSVDSESEIIDYFNIINNVKPQRWDHDPNLLAHAYIVALEKQYNPNKKNQMIKQGKRNRPYLSSDDLRQVLVQYSHKLKQDKESIKRFIENVIEYNKKTLKSFELLLLDEKEKNKKIIISCIDKDFALAFDTKLGWIDKCLN